MVKNPLTSFINVFGLSVAIAICLTVYAFLEYDYSIDRFHKYSDEVYLTTFFVDRDGAPEHYGTSPAPLGEMLQEDFTQVKKVCRIEDRNVVVKYEENVFYERVRYADPEFLEMLTFPLKWGTSGSLSDINSIILSEEMAVKYFGDENPVGRDMLVKFDEDKSKTFKVTGVAEPFPDAHIIDFGFLINFENFRYTDPGFRSGDWSEFIAATLIQVEDPADMSAIEQKMEKYRTLQNEAQKDWPISAFHFERLPELHLNARNLRDAISHDYSLEARVSLPVIALFMLILACFNYINMAIVSATKRLKEIGVRKVIGANRTRVIIQFLAENIFVTFFALILGFALGAAVVLPWFKNMAEIEMSLGLVNMNLWTFLAALLFVTGILSGLYPALYISRFQTIQIFKGSVQFGKKNPLTKVFLGVQLVLACVLITGAIMYAQNSAYLATKDWGYDPERVLYVNVPDASAFNQLQASMTQNPDVLSTAGSQHHLGRETASAVVHTPERQYEVHELSVDAAYFETMGLPLKEGRVFKAHHEGERHSVVANESLVRNMALENPVGQVFKIDSARYEVIGVVTDFHNFSFYDKIRPTIFKVADKKDYRYLSLKVSSGAEQETYEAVQEQWATLFPETPFQGGFQEDVWGWFYADLDKQIRFSRAVALVAVLLASLGLYGLVTLNVSGRIKEFSIRKVMGAGFKNLSVNITRPYIVLTVVALIIGAPVSYVLIKANIEMMYPDPMPMSYSSVAVAVGILVSVLMAVVFSQVRRVSRSNPVNGLRVE